MKSSIHLNCDLGEGGGFDGQLMPFLSACNIACGGHFGDRKTVSDTVDLALRHKVQIGAHPSYPDKKNFGRQSIAISLKDLKHSLREQIELVKTEVEKRGQSLHHVKPHGALYNDLVNDSEKAKAVVEIILEVDASLILFAPPRSVVHEWARDKLTVWTEGFADRNYNSDFSLVSRQEPHAVLDAKKEVFNRIYEVATTGIITANDQKKLKADFDTICLHSDTQNAVEILRYVYEELKKCQIEIAK